MMYIDTAFSGVQNRNNIKSVEELSKINLGSKEDCYATYFNFGEDLRSYVEKTKSVKGFSGEFSADFLPFDIDSENIDQAKNNAIKIVECLQMRYGLLNGDIDVYFSGAKGFHIQVPSAVFGDFKAAGNLDRIFRDLALEISAGFEIDVVIYESMRLWRIPNTINSKSGLHKIQLSVEELFTLTIEQIKEMAKLPRQVKVLEPQQSQVLTDLYWAVKLSLENKPKLQITEQKSVYPAQEKFCIYSMLNNGVPKGERNNAILRMGAYFKTKFPVSFVESMMREWIKVHGIEVTKEDEIENTVKNSFAEYDFGCNDGLLKKYCSDKCTFPLKKQSQYTVKTIEDLEREYIQYIKEIDSVKIDLSGWLSKFGLVSRGLTAGEVMIVIAGSGIGKTAFLQNLLLNIPVPAVFFSYELPELLTYERFYQMSNRCTGERVEENYKQGEIRSSGLKKTLGGLSLVFDSAVNVDEIPNIVTKIEQERQVKLKIVAIDYLGFVKGGHGSRYERVSYVAEKLKDIAKKTNSVVICLAQVSRQEGAKGDVELDITSGKDSGSIENTGDLVLGMYRPYKNEKEKEDNIIRIKILKNRKGKDNVSIDCLFNKDTLQISEAYFGQKNNS